MNANELAEIQAFKTEELTMWERNHTATMLRQQQAEYYSLLVNHDKLYAKVVEQQAEIEMLKTKTLTDEEIKELSEEHLDMDWQTGVIDFARAILRKAQNK